MILTVTRLGIIACDYLVKGYYENRYISAPEIADHYNMNVRALMPALRQMTRMGLLRSRVGGKEPGFIFAKDPVEITLYNVLSVLEGDAQFNCCKDLMPDLKCDCKDKTQCGLFSLFIGVVDNATNSLNNISINEYSKSLNLV